MHRSILTLVYIHNDRLHVSANHVTIFGEVIHIGQIDYRVQIEIIKV
jgi:hypothetical protein